MSNGKEQNARSFFAWIGLAAVILPVLYVLSIGPAIWLLDKRLISVRSYLWFDQNVYAPVWDLAGGCGPIDRALTWYGNLWHRNNGFRQLTEEPDSPVGIETAATDKD